MRFLMISALLVATASCTWPPPAPSSPAAAGPEPVFYTPLGWLFGPLVPVPPARLTLSNYSFDNARVQTVVTGHPDCVAREGTAAADFTLPLNGTRVIEAAPGTDVCWRRAVDADKNPEPPPSEPGWSEWNRAFTSAGRPIDSRL